MNQVLGGVFAVVVLGLLAGSAWYLGARLQASFALRSRRMTIAAVGAALLGAGTATFATAKAVGAFASAANVLGGYWLVFHLYAVLSFLGLQLVQLRWRLAARRAGFAALLIALSATVTGAVLADSFTVSDTELRLPNLAREVKVMHLSDIHLGHHRGRDYLARIVEETNRQRPDLVVITGDLIDAASALEPRVLEPLSQLAAPSYFVGGNHEKYVDAQRTFELVAQQGVRVLHNEVVETPDFQLIGLDYMNADEEAFDMHPSDDPKTIKSVLASLTWSDAKPSLLLHHSPAGVQYAAAKGVDLVLAGHTHAGQVFPMTLLAKLMFPINRGVQRQEDTTVFVSQGVGTFVARVRLGSRNELALLHLKKESAP